MALLFFIISMILLVLYFKEHNKNKKIERDYKYINARLLDIINDSENNYILIPSDIKVVKETAKGINNLLEKFYGRQIDYNRNQKVILQIFTNISHDLRTPITVLKGYIEMLYLQSQKEDLPPVIHTTIEKMQRNSQELVHSVNSLFNLAKIQSGDMVFHIQKVNLTQVCHEIILEFYTILEEEKFHVEVNIEDKPLYANVDIEAVGRILKNLIDNAIQYGNAGKFLGISLYKKDSHIYIEVEDHGAGISEKDKIHIFTRAYTADRKKGNGLGLAISQELANSMGGSISVVSIPQKKNCIHNPIIKLEKS
ncbi:MAG: sensor histidine kinase [Faecalimonas umbilicata]|uniref:sensor histidine kinase n=1 Tax=Faecalimonas umbilicata TaxID=1912855 RepID=UPI00300F1063